MLSSMWTKIYLKAITGLCANHSNAFGNLSSKENMARKIIEEAILIADEGSKKFKELNRDRYVPSPVTHA